MVSPNRKPSCMRAYRGWSRECVGSGPFSRWVAREVLKGTNSPFFRPCRTLPCMPRRFQSWRNMQHGFPFPRQTSLSRVDLPGMEIHNTSWLPGPHVEPAPGPSRCTTGAGFEGIHHSRQPGGGVPRHGPLEEESQSTTSR